MTVSKPHGALRHVFRAPTFLYRHNLGLLLDHRFCELTHTGRKTGIQRHTVLEVVHFDRHTRRTVVMAGFGRASDWYRNIMVAPPVLLTTGRQRFRPEFRELGEDEACAMFAGYERRNRAFAPIVRRVLSWLVGWTYDGSEQARRRLVRERPLIEFRPAA